MSNFNLAYPLVRHIDSTVIAEGLTKRELMAAMMLQGSLSSGKLLNIQDAARFAVLTADALIDALAESQSQG